MFRAPISGLEFRWAPAGGRDDLFLMETTGLAGAAGLVERRFRYADGTVVDAAALPVGDVDALIVALRREALGDRLVAEGRCTACDAPVDVDFSLAGYVTHRRPRATRLAVRDGDSGWWVLRRTGTRFRLPTVGDVLAAADVSRPREALLTACVDGAGWQSAERAMAAIAPTLRSEVSGTCPECAAAVTLDVDARELCLQELRFLASGVLDDVHLLASAYGWHEAEVLDLPSARRAAYAGLVRGSHDRTTVGAFDA